MTLVLSPQDLQQLENKNILKANLEKQVDNFKNGFPPLTLIKPATLNDGIKILNKNSQEEYQTYFENQKKDFQIIKFVPASGMASRMFKDLYNFIEQFNESEEQYKDFVEGKLFSSVRFFLENLEKFPFIKILEEKISAQGKNITYLRVTRAFKSILKYVLNESGLNYGTLPKLLLLFHTYTREGQTFYRTSLQEHVIEAINCFKLSDKSVHLHFTISPEHETLFKDHLNSIAELYEKNDNVHFEVSHSFQDPSTDTIAVDEHNNLFRLDDGRLLFRRGGHGALLKNLNSLSEDIIFIKNVDNIIHEDHQPLVYRWKKILGGVLIRAQKDIFQLINTLEGKSIENLSTIEKQLKDDYNVVLPTAYFGYTKESKINYIKYVLDRPIRVCGMVAKSDSKGGGPFWVEKDSILSLQIIEDAQIQNDSQDQITISHQATHFNPVDIVFSTKNHKGKKFDLLQFVDLKTGFITSKTQNGKKLKAQELPGLWNGSMANWISIFVEVPFETFNPVKFVNDLLNPRHICKL